MKTRAPNGQVGAVLMLKLPPKLKRQAARAAKAEGVTVSEWWRRAAQERLPPLPDTPGKG